MNYRGENVTAHINKETAALKGYCGYFDAGLDETLKLTLNALHSSQTAVSFGDYIPQPHNVRIPTHSRSPP